MAKKSFYGYFKESMNSLGLPAPDSLFGSLTAATLNISALLKLVEKFGTRATLGEVVATNPEGVLSVALAQEVLTVAAGVTAAYYVGACIGALAYATGQYSSDKLWASNGYTVGQLVNRAMAHGIKIPQEMSAVLAENPRLRRVAMT